MFPGVKTPGYSQDVPPGHHLDVSALPQEKGSAGAPPAVFRALAEDIRMRVGNAPAVWQLRVPTGTNRVGAVGNPRRRARSPNSHTYRAWWLTVLLLALSIPVAETAKTEEPPKVVSVPSALVQSPAAKPPWGRIVMVGASASAGFTEAEPFGGPKTLQHRLSLYLDAALLAAHEPVQDLANAMFFLQPEAAGRYQIDLALKARPTLVVGIDFLFWFCYGEDPSEKERLQRFEKGLKLLENVQCPLVLGDIPDASGASNDMLPADQIPSAATMSAANRRLKEWAAGRRQIVIVSLSGFMRTAMADQALTIHGHIVPAGKTRELLQSDKLHPSALGSAVLALAILDAVQSKWPAPSTAEIRWDPKEVLRLGLKASQEPPNNPAKQATPVPAGK